MAKTYDFHLTESGLQDLKKELEDLKKQRLEVAEKLKTAKEQGDLSENSEWVNAIEEQQYVQNRIREVEHIIRNAEIISAPRDNNAVQLGSTVHLNHNGKQRVYSIVGSLESDPEAGKISDESPIGKALLGKKEGDTIEIKTPSGNTTYKIAKIS